MGSPKTKNIELVEGETRTIRVTAFDSSNAVITTAKTEITPAKEGVVSVETTGNNHKITALGVKKEDSTTLKIEVNDQEQPDQELTVKVLEAVQKIEAEGGTGVSLAEGDHFTLKFQLKGTQSETLDPVTQPIAFRMAPALVPVLRVERDPIQGGYLLTANALPQGTTVPISGTVIFRALNGPGKEPLPLVINVTVRQKLGYITFEPPPRGFLLPGGNFTTLAVVRGRNGTPLTSYGVEFTAEHPGDLKWISLSPEGNKINVFWNDPADEQITKPDGTKEKRPGQVRIRAVARSGAAGEEIEGFILVRMGEVTKFALVKVKLNLMDQVTAADLYGKVLSDEYYVLTVRLYNNLRDDVTKEFTGDSILAYSSSMEISVGLEKKFNPDTDSEFPNVIGKGAARDLAKKRRDAAVARANTQADSEIAAAAAAQTDLKDAIRTEQEAGSAARRAREEAINLRDKLPGLQAALKRLELTDNRVRRSREWRETKADYDRAYAEAADATYDANVKIKRAHEAAEDTNRVRASIRRAAANRVTVSQNIVADSDPDTVIDDGRWHAVNPADFNRIIESEVPDAEPLPLLPPLDPDVLGDNISPEGQKKEITGEEKPKGDEDPPCGGTITYRPFTFEMMVNTVDRRDGRSRRARLFKLLDAIGIGTSFITSIAVPGNSSDLPLGLEKYGNLLIPGIDKLYTNVKEQQRQNIVSQAMKEIEEIPFGSDITRVIFIPKKSIRGLIRGHDSRISEVCPFYFKIEVAIIQKRSTVTAGQP